MNTNVCHCVVIRIRNRKSIKTFTNIVSPFSIFINKYTAFLDSMSASSEGGAGGTVGGSAVGTATTTAPGMY